MNDKRQIGLDDAYAVKTPADNLRLYAEWANTYESEFVANKGWVAFLRVAELLSRYHEDVGGAVLDVGCGTGIGGVALHECGFEVLDGIDISSDMLAEARRKKTGSGQPVYRRLIEADLTKTVPIERAQYAGMVSAGTFTHGHLGPGALDELWRVAAPGAICVISVNASHYRDRGFEAKLAADGQCGTIELLDVVEIDMYIRPPSDVAPDNQKASVAICRRTG